MVVPVLGHPVWRIVYLWIDLPRVKMRHILSLHPLIVEKSRTREEILCPFLLYCFIQCHLMVVKRCHMTYKLKSYDKSLVWRQKLLILSFLEYTIIEYILVIQLKIVFKIWTAQLTTLSFQNVLCIGSFETVSSTLLFRLQLFNHSIS